MLKHIRNVSDESIVEQWAENCYYQHFCGEGSFVPGEPCEASELVHFRNRIGPQGIELIFRESIRVNGADAEEPSVKADTTVQEKNIEFPTDAKLHRKIISRCRKISLQQGLPVRQSYTRTLRGLSVDQRFRSHPKQRGRALRADRKVRTIAGRLVREIERNLPPDSPHHEDLALYRRVLAQRRKDSDKVYSLHEPDVKCISKGKDHKKYEFGNKVSLTVTENTGAARAGESSGRSASATPTTATRCQRSSSSTSRSSEGPPARSPSTGATGAGRRSGRQTSTYPSRSTTRS